MTAPIEQRDANRLELANLLAERGLRGVQRVAARAKFSSSATATKYRRCRSSTPKG
jgi:hypothetical protein